MIDIWKSLDFTEDSVICKKLKKQAEDLKDMSKGVIYGEVRRSSREEVRVYDMYIVSNRTVRSGDKEVKVFTVEENKLENGEVLLLVDDEQHCIEKSTFINDLVEIVKKSASSKANDLYERSHTWPVTYRRFA